MPGVLLGFIVSSLIGSGFHLWRGGGAGRLLFFLTLSWSGFAIGHFGAEIILWNFLRVGSVNLGAGIITAIVFLLLGSWLARPQQSGSKNSSKKRRK